MAQTAVPSMGVLTACQVSPLSSLRMMPLSHPASTLDVVPGTGVRQRTTASECMP